MTKRIRVTVGDVIAATAEAAGMTRAQLIAPTRRMAIVRPRYVAVFIARSLTNASLPALANRFQYADHTSILYAVRRAPDLIASDPALSRLVAAATAKSIAIATARASSGDGSGAPPPPVARLAA